MAVEQAGQRSAQLPSQLDDPLLAREWLAVAWSSEIPLHQIVARRAMGRDLVLWRSTEGLHCWRDLCIHRGARLSLGRVRPADCSPHASNSIAPAVASRTSAPDRDCLICPYHAWEYAPTGECVRIPAQPDLAPPAKAHTETYPVQERYGVVWIAVTEPCRPVPDFPIAEDSTFRSILAGPYRFHAKGPRVVENLLDVAHLGFVHAGLLGDPQRGEVLDYAVTPGSLEPNGPGPEAKEIPMWQPDPDGTGQPALVSYHYWVNTPLTAGLIKTHGDQRFGILAQVAPIDDEYCEARLIMCLNYGNGIPDAELVSFQDRVTEQDRIIVESQRPELLPLDLQAELHLRSDRMAIAYRKWLQAIGFTYGTA
jgi:phenylpropionate dioxygenase-like ring-hydroxylating dioxygenase large terminal subunit